MIIRLPEKFHGKTKQSVQSEKRPENGPCRWLEATDPPETEIHHRPLQKCLVQLGWMARHSAGARIGEDNAPRDGSHATVQFTVDKVADATEPQSDRRRHEADIEH